MRSLLDYLVKYSYVFLFILLEILSLVLLFGFNDRQKLAFVTSANSVSGSIYELFSNVSTSAARILSWLRRMPVCAACCMS